MYLFSVDEGKLCTVMQSPSGKWDSLQSSGSGGDVTFRHVTCCAPEVGVDGTLCELCE